MDVCTYVVNEGHGLDVLDVERGWGGKKRHWNARCSAKGSAENVSTMRTACPSPCSGRARECCCHGYRWEGVGEREPWGAG